MYKVNLAKKGKTPIYAWASKDKEGRYLVPTVNGRTWVVKGEPPPSKLKKAYWNGKRLLVQGLNSFPRIMENGVGDIIEEIIRILFLILWLIRRKSNKGV